MDSEQRVDGARKSANDAPVHRTGPRPSVQIGYVVGAGITSIVLSAVLHERFPERAPANLFFGFFWLFFALGAALLGWAMGTFRRSLFLASLFVVAALTGWQFGLTGFSALAGAVAFVGEMLRLRKKHLHSKTP